MKSSIRRERDARTVNKMEVRTGETGTKVLVRSRPGLERDSLFAYKKRVQGFVWAKSHSTVKSGIIWLPPDGPFSFGLLRHSCSFRCFGSLSWSGAAGLLA
ncbi:hypothetical protein ACVNHC_19520 [Pannonibacter sp. Q-1]